MGPLHRHRSISLRGCEEDALRYETSGEPERLTARPRATCSPLYGWRLTLAEGGDARATAPEVTTYHLVQGQPFEDP